MTLKKNNSVALGKFNFENNFVDIENLVQFYLYNLKNLCQFILLFSYFTEA